MRTGAGLINAFLFLFLVIAAHSLLSKWQTPADPSKYSGKGSRSGNGTARGGQRSTNSTLISDIRKSREYREPGRGFVEAWPPGPGELFNGAPPGAFEQPRQRPYDSEDEERAALHRLVFSQPDQGDYAEESKPRMMPDHSGLHMAAESSTTSDLPMFYIRPDARSEGMTDYVSGIESWGAGYLPVMV